MTFAKSDLITKKDTIIGNIANSIASSINSQISSDCKIVQNQISKIDIQCVPPKTSCPSITCSNITCNDCTQCIAKIAPTLFTDTCDKIDCDKALYEQIRNDYCSILCNCNVQELDMKNILNLDSACTIKSVDINKITEQIVDDLKTNLEIAIENPSAIKNELVSNIITTVINSINQTVSQTQTVSLQGHGEIKVLSLTVVSDIIMKAIQNNEKSLNVINDLVNKLIDDIKISINRDITLSIEDIIEDNKKYFIFILGTIGICLVLVMILLSYKVFKQNTMYERAK